MLDDSWETVLAELLELALDVRKVFGMDKVHHVPATKRLRVVAERSVFVPDERESAVEVHDRDKVGEVIDYARVELLRCHELIAELFLFGDVLQDPGDRIGCSMSVPLELSDASDSPWRVGATRLDGELDIAGRVLLDQIGHGSPGPISIAVDDPPVHAFG